MQGKSKLKVAHRRLLAFGGGLALTCLISIVSLWRTSTAYAQFEDLSRVKLANLTTSYDWIVGLLQTAQLTRDVSLMDDPNKYPIAGKVVWITPAGANNNKAQGIGVHFPADETGQRAKLRIEEILGAALRSSRATHTL